MKDDKYTPFVDALKDKFANASRGDVIHWTEIEAVMGRGRYEEGGMRIIWRFRRWLLVQREIVTLPMNTVGIRLLTHSEAAQEVPVLRQRKAYRQVNKGLKELAAVNQSSISDALRRAVAMQQGYMAANRLSLGRAKRAGTVVGRKSQTHPIRKVI